MLKRPRLLTFEIIIHFNDEEIKENRIQLYEDFISIKNDITFSTTLSYNNANFNFGNKRNRFMSA